MFRVSKSAALVIDAPRVFGALWLGLFYGLVLCMASPVGAEDRIVLRNLKMIDDQVVAFDEDGVRLQNKKIIPWDMIERATVTQEKQKEFDRLLKELGEPLYRIRRRMTAGDYKGTLSHAEAIYPRYVGRRSRTAYMVFQALMWARLDSGKREEALEPYLRCYEYLRTSKKKTAALPGKRRLQFDPITGMTPELSSVWFNAEAAKKVLPEVIKTANAMKKPLPDGVRIYYASLVLAASQPAKAKPVLAKINDKQPSIVELRDILLAQSELADGRAEVAATQLENILSDASPANVPIARYWLGMAKVAVDNEQIRREGVLHLLHVPALHSKEYPQLAGAALYQSMRVLAELKDPQGKRALRKELLTRYGQTWHSAKVRAELNRHKDE